MSDRTIGSRLAGRISVSWKLKSGFEQLPINGVTTAYCRSPASRAHPADGRIKGALSIVFKEATSLTTFKSRHQQQNGADSWTEFQESSCKIRFPSRSLSAVLREVKIVPQRWIPAMA